MKKLIQYFVDRPLLVNLITIFVIVVGYYSLTQINKEGYPMVTRNRLYIYTVYPGASPDEVEVNVTIPMEEAIQGLDGIDEFTSVSRENYSEIRVFIDEDSKNPEKVKTEIRRAVDNVDLPEDVTKNPEIFEWKVSAFPVIHIGLYSDTLDYSTLRTRALDLKKELTSLEDVSLVSEEAILEREIKIELDLDKLNANFISLEEVINAIQINNFELTGGVYEDENVDKIITVSSKLKTAEDVGNVILRSTFEGNRIDLGDVAEIEDGFEEKTEIFRLNGRPAVALSVSKKQSADIITIVNQIKECVEEYKVTLEGEDIEIEYAWDLSEQTRIRLDIVKNNAIIGLILVVIILFLFLNFRNALWTALGIPFSIAFAMIFLRQFDVTINSVSLLGVIVVLGMVVDDAIIIAENIYRHHIMGKPWRIAAYDATREMVYPVLSTIVTTIVAFLSLYNLEGIMGEFAKEIPLVVIFVLAGSFIESILILPNHVSHRYVKSAKDVQLKEKKFIIWMQNGYAKLLKKALKFRWLVIPFFGILLYLAIYALFLSDIIKFINFPTEEAQEMVISGEVRDGQNLEYTAKKVQLLEKGLLHFSNEVESFFSTIGEIGYPEVFEIEVFLTPASERPDVPAQDIYEDIRNLINASGSFTNMVYELVSGGPGEGRAIKVEIVGNDNDIRRELSDEMVNYLSDIDGVIDLTRSDEENKRELQIDIDYETAARVFVSPQSVAYTIRAAFNGVIASTLQTPDELVEYRVLLEEQYRTNINTLYNLKILNDQYQLVYLHTLIETNEQPMVSKIDHYNGDRNTIIEADVEEEIITPLEVLNRIEEDFGDFEKDNPGFRIFIGGEAEESAETINSMIEAAILAFAAIFFILIFQFKSISQAVMVMLAIPFSFIGIAIALYVHNMPLSAMALFGGVGLIGVVVNDSLVMVDYLNSMRGKMHRKNQIDIIVDGAVTRLRPVMLTTLTTVAGLLPTAYGLGGRDAMIIPTTMVMAWGLFFATVLTLVLIPSFYLVEFNSKYTMKRIGKSIKTRQRLQRFKKMQNHPPGKSSL